MTPCPYAALIELAEIVHGSREDESPRVDHEMLRGWLAALMLLIEQRDRAREATVEMALAAITDGGEG